MAIKGLTVLFDLAFKGLEDFSKLEGSVGGLVSQFTNLDKILGDENSGGILGKLTKIASLSGLGGLGGVAVSSTVEDSALARARKYALATDEVGKEMEILRRTLITKENLPSGVASASVTKIAEELGSRVVSPEGTEMATALAKLVYATEMDTGVSYEILKTGITKLGLSTEKAMDLGTNLAQAFKGDTEALSEALKVATEESALMMGVDPNKAIAGLAGSYRVAREKGLAQPNVLSNVLAKIIASAKGDNPDAIRLLQASGGDITQMLPALLGKDEKLLGYALSDQALANLTGMSRAQLSLYEGGQTADLGISSTQKAVEAALTETGDFFKMIKDGLFHLQFMANDLLEQLIKSKEAIVGITGATVGGAVLGTISGAGATTGGLASLMALPGIGMLGALGHQTYKYFTPEGKDERAKAMKSFQDAGGFSSILTGFKQSVKHPIDNQVYMNENGEFVKRGDAMKQLPVVNQININVPANPMGGNHSYSEGIVNGNLNNSSR